ncbi:MAG: PQQ-like beta-propeller repeat protein [Acidobacteria bacterium]|nr:PQQ-like beta-propeller repeat protein [Acidobacteriota bacterium]
MLLLQAPPAQVAVLPRRELLAEDLAWDAPTGRWFVSSVHRGLILTQSPEGSWRVFASPGKVAVLALALDRPRHLLWAAWAGLPQVEGLGADDAGRTGLVAFDLATGLERARVEGAERGGALGDLALGPDGTVYASDGLKGGVYALRPGSLALEPLVPSGTFRSPQTPVVVGDSLLIPDYSRGLALLPLEGGAPRWLTAPGGFDLRGLDGMAKSGKAIYAVQNGTSPNRVLELFLAPDHSAITFVKVLLRLPEATHLVAHDGKLFVLADNGWERYRPSGQLLPDLPPEPAPHILSIPLP